MIRPKFRRFSWTLEDFFSTSNFNTFNYTAPKEVREYAGVWDITGYGTPHFFFFMRCQYGQPDYCQTPLLKWARFCAKTEVKRRAACMCYRNRVENRLKKFFRVFFNLLVFRVNQLQKVSVIHFHIAFYVYFTMQHFTVTNMWLKKNARYFQNGVISRVWDTPCNGEYWADFSRKYCRFRTEIINKVGSDSRESSKSTKKEGNTNEGNTTSQAFKSKDITTIGWWWRVLHHFLAFFAEKADVCQLHHMQHMQVSCSFEMCWHARKFLHLRTLWQGYGWRKLWIKMVIFVF